MQTAAAALDAYEVTGEPRVARVGRARSWSGSGGSTGTGARRPVRYGPGAGRRRKACCPRGLKPVQDTPTPSPNGVAGITLARLHAAHRRRRAGASGARCSSAAFAGGASELGLHGAAYLLALDWQLNPATHLVVIGDAGRLRGGGDAPNRAGAASHHAGWSSGSHPPRRSAGRLPGRSRAMLAAARYTGLCLRGRLQPAGAQPAVISLAESCRRLSSEGALRVPHCVPGDRHLP